ncbi:hypothetical protein RC54_12605 [Herbaspirillum rubrisubalbicans]|uniref:Uncharacterized protein n=1 Tax=Herbaspirillum rubrisubalbicans TaxID=80842 RepID=A0AAD0U984_9BURK|nr:hypothetical protein RC54_12605 [Herbaspirillum rubrisubalbicans]
MSVFPLFERIPSFVGQARYFVSLLWLLHVARYDDVIFQRLSTVCDDADELLQGRHLAAARG